MQRRNKVLILGIDGADWSVINPLIDKGELPFLAGLKESGGYGNLISTLPPVSAPAWTSFQTGQSPANHGVFDFEDIIHRRRYPTSEPRVVDSSNVKAKRFWDFLDQNELQGCFINLPLTFPFPNTNSLLVSSLLTPASEIYCNRMEVYRKLREIDYIVDPEPFHTAPSLIRRMAAKKETFKTAVAAADKRKEAMFEVMDEKFVITFCLFRGSDVIQHLFWGEKEVERYYRHLDPLLAKIYQRFKEINRDSPTLLLVLSDHGFHAGPLYRFNIVNWLIAERFITEKPQEPGSLAAFRPLYRPFKSLLERGAMSDLANKIKEYLWGNQLRKIGKQFVAKAGVEPVHFGLYCDRQKEVSELIKKLRALSYRNKKVFKEVYRREEIYHGVYEEDLPEILFLPAEDFTVDPFPLKKQTFEQNGSPLRGEHRSARDGIFLSKGNGLANGRLSEIAIEDLLPTCLHVLDIPIPEDLDGVVRESLFAKNSPLKRRKPVMISRQREVEDKLERELGKYE